MKQADRRSFRLLRAVFAKDDGAVFTTYGDAKVEDPGREAGERARPA